MQHPRRRLELADPVTPGGDQAGQLGDARGIGAGGAADQDLAFGDQDVTALDVVGAGDGGDRAVEPGQRRRHRRRLAEP